VYSDYLACSLRHCRPAALNLAVPFDDTNEVFAPCSQLSGRMMVSWIITVYASPTAYLQKGHLATGAALTHHLLTPLLSVRPPML